MYGGRLVPGEPVVPQVLANFTGNCFRRPCSIAPDYVDTEFPKENSSMVVEGRGYSTLKWDLAMICGQ